MKVLVATPYRVETCDRLVERAQVLYDRLTYPDKVHGLYANAGGYSQDYESNANARNELLEQHLTDDITHVLWIDVDLVNYPQDLIERLAELDGVTAPLVMLDKADRFYDIGAFIQDGQRAQMWPPYFDTNRDLESVGSCYLISAEVYRKGARYRGNGWLTEHWPVMQQARQMGMRVRCRADVTAWHAYLPDYGMRWSNLMEQPKKAIILLESCGGLWGVGGAGETVYVTYDVAESLMRGGLAVDPHAPPEVKKNSPARKSKRASES